MKVLIIAGGVFPSVKLLEEELKSSSVVICADSGANGLYSNNVTPDILMGDFDSISKEALKYFEEKGCAIDKYPKEKDLTDSEIALKKALELGAKEIVFLGCTGHRLDHVMGNLGLLAKCCELNVEAYIKDDNNTIFAVKKPVKLKGSLGELFSLCSFGDFVDNLSVKGAKYELNNYLLRIGDPRTISNEFFHEEVDITFSSGMLIIIKSRD